MLGYENIQFKRWKNNGVMLQYSNTFPSLQTLSNLKINDYLKKEFLFLGIGLPMIGEKYKKSKLIKGKYLPRYINFSDIPVGTANLGSAGGGKSNTMNQYLYSIFYNFEKIEKFYFVDFKGGIEAQPILDLEKKYNTGKIKVFDDNRIELYKTLKLLYFINKSRMRYLKYYKKKKFTNDFIVLLFDELAEILDYSTNTKEEKFIQDKIIFYIESLLRTGRSQGFRIFYSTQSYLSTSSGLTSGMKNNTKLKIAHQLGSKLQVGSIKPIEELEELSIYPTNYDVGKNVVINESDNKIYEVRSLYVPDNFIDSIILNTNKNVDLSNELLVFYNEIYNEMKNDLKKSNVADDLVYPLDEIAKELGLEILVQKEVVIEEEKIPSNLEIPSKKRLDIVKKINSKKIEKSKREEVDTFLAKPKYKDKEVELLSDNELLKIHKEVESLSLKTIENEKSKEEIDSFLKSLK